MVKVSFNSPDWDIELEMPGVPRMGETIVVDEEQWLVTEVVWNLDGWNGYNPTIHISVDPKPAE